MRAAFATADLAAQLIWRAERFLTALFLQDWWAQCVWPAHNLCVPAAAYALSYELLIIQNGTAKKKKLEGLLNLSEAVVSAFDSSASF